MYFLREAQNTTMKEFSFLTHLKILNMVKPLDPTTNL